MTESPRSERVVYGISVASELSGISQQTLRLYEQRGLLTPFPHARRRPGATARRTSTDYARLQRDSDSEMADSASD